MGHARLRRVVLNDFRSFSGRHEVELPDHGLVVLRGNSGAGKSNLLLGLAYAFKYCRLPARTLTSWKAEEKDSMYVEVEMDTHEGPVVLHRGTSGCWLKVGDREVRGAVKEVDKELERLLGGVDPDMREILTYRDQARPRAFLAMRDSTGLKDFLLGVLQLRNLEADIDKTLKTLATERPKLASLVLAVEAAKARYDRETAEYHPPTVEDLEPLRGRLAEARAALTTATAAMEAERSALRVALREEVERGRAAASSKRAEREAVLSEDIPEPPAQPLSARHTKAIERLQTCDLLLADATVAEVVRRREYDAEISVLREELRQLRHNRDLEREARSKADRKLEELKELRAARDLCPKCGQIWNSHAEALLRLEAEVADLVSRLSQFSGAAAMVGAKETELEGLSWESDPRLGDLRETRQKILKVIEVEKTSEDAKAREARATYEEKLRDQRRRCSTLLDEAAAAEALVLSDPNRPSIAVSERLVRASEEADLAAAKVRSASSALEEAERRNRDERAHSDSQEARVQREAAGYMTAVAHERAYEVAVAQESDYLDMLRGFRDRIFDEVLEEIATTANDVIEDLPNTSHMSLRFRTEIKTASGGVKQEIRPAVSVRGVERALEDGVSGGQATSLMLAADVAAVSVVSARLGVDLGWLIFDESFPGHDPVVKRACLEVLQRVAEKKLVVIVDHASELQEMFDATIRVELENDESRFA